MLGPGAFVAGFVLAGLDHLYPILNMLRKRKIEHTVETNAIMRRGRSGGALFRSIHTDIFEGCILFWTALNTSRLNEVLARSGG
jgi:hypothetical protein